jgi:hypothetical protein
MADNSQRQSKYALNVWLSVGPQHLPRIYLVHAMTKPRVAQDKRNPIEMTERVGYVLSNTIVLSRNSACI